MDISDISDLSLSSEEENDVPSVNHRTRMNPMTHYSDSEFKQHYRVSKEVVTELVRLIDGIEPTTKRNKSISAIEQILLTISFYATGGFQVTVADNVRVHKSTACRIIKRISLAIARLRPVFIKMPATAEERLSVKSGFYMLANFPNVIGAVDCTHVKIQSVGGPQAELFRNRKGYFSLNTQAICDSQLRIQDIICRWPGSVHATTIFNNSHIHADFESGVYGKDFLLGGSGYPCRSYLLTPFLQPRTNGEEAYNRAQVATRNPIERCFGVLKRRFPCLSMGLRVKLDTAMNIVVACAVLHNIAINHNDNIDDMVDVEAAIPEEMYEIAGRNNENTTVRSSLVTTHFNR